MSSQVATSPQKSDYSSEAADKPEMDPPIGVDSDESDDEETDDDDARSEDEIEGIAWEMRELEKKFPQLRSYYALRDRLGEGTFSSVYKAVDLKHDEMDNSDWCQHCKPLNTQLPTPLPTSSSSSRPEFSLKRRRGQDEQDYEEEEHDEQPIAKKQKRQKIYVALKRIYVTSSPTRILNEIELLTTLRGHPNVANLISAFREEDQVLVVMPYEKHADFRDFYRTLPLDGIRTYMRCIFSGVAFAHRHNIIHRDIKPANFLFNPATGSGVLADFGLAETFNPAHWHSKCLHSLPCAALDLPHGKLLDEPRTLMDQIESNAAEFREAPFAVRRKRNFVGPWIPTEEFQEDEIREAAEDMEDFLSGWEPARPWNKAKGRVGHLKPENDKRPTLRANRAGTRGFRAPEVLLKCPDQTISLDIWSVGIVLLCFLTRRFPFFNSNDDTEALMEISTIFGKTKLEACAAIHNRTFVTNVPPVVDPEFTSLHQLVHSLNPRIFDENAPEDDPAPHNFDWYNTDNALFQAVDLMKKSLHLDCTKRISAEDALLHPFFTFGSIPSASDSE